MISCVEPFEFETISFENALVVEATITNEFKHQEIRLTRTFKFEEDAPKAETNADVKITDDLQNIYNFEENTPGEYTSVLEFSAESAKAYQLTIITKDGRVYNSKPSQLPQSTEINELLAVSEIKPDGTSGVSIAVNSFDPTGNARYYRYEYEETYKIIAILWSPLDAIVISDQPPFEVGTTPRTQEERICFKTIINTEIRQTETFGLQEDRVTQFPIQFIASNNPIIRERYSILVRQYVQSLEAFNYYRVLSELSGSESLLSQNQPGFISSNISSVDNPEEKVLGFFDISSVSTKRVFFNFRDLFTVENRPFYFIDCEFAAPELTDPNTENVSPLINLIKTNDYKFFDINMGQIENENLPGPYLMVLRPCGDCTALGTNIRPDFWID